MIRANTVFPEFISCTSNEMDAAMLRKIFKPINNFLLLILIVSVTYITPSLKRWNSSEIL